MKKVMIGLLILIPIIILLVVALVTNIVSLNAHIAVEDLQLTYKGTQNVAYFISIPINEGAVNLYDFIDVNVYPNKATNKTVEWQIAGDIEYTDEDYEKDYSAYAKKMRKLKDDLSEKFDDGIRFVGKEREAFEAVCREYYYNVSEKDAIIDAMADLLYEEEKLSPAAVFVDDNGKEVVSNTSGVMNIGSYCNFTIRAVAENVSKTMSISIVGYDVEQVVVSVPEGNDNTLEVGESVRLLASYTPIQSIVNETIWSSSDEDVLSVDSNGVVTAKRASSNPVIITLKASVYSSENSQNKEYVEGQIEIQPIASGASSIYGKKNVVTSESRKTLSLKEIGLVKDEITNVANGTLENDIIIVTKYPVTLTLTSGRQFSLESCRNGSIAIANSVFFERGNGYVLSVGENSLKLTAVWEDMLEDGYPQGIVWTSSDESIATVDENGHIVGLSDGVVTIRAERKDEQNGDVFGAEIEINVRRKISSIQLRTSNESLAIGLARETVFASEKYVNVSLNNAKTANSTKIVVQGEPDNANESDLASFYASFVFEIVEGKEFAHMDEETLNQVVFDSSKLEGKGKQKVVVRVSAKYPKYESVTKFVTKEVTLTVVYGVAVNNMDELRVASGDQQAYVQSEGNLVVRSDEDRTYWAKEGVDEFYKVYRSNYSLRNYAIVLTDNCMYEERLDEDGKPITWTSWWDIVVVYGNVYGNNKKIYAKLGTMYDDGYILRIGWGGLTISNLILRANEIGMEDLDINNVSEFQSNVCEINARDGRWFEDEGNHITLEYSIIENGNKGINLYNTDITFKGCIIRNMTECGIYAPYRMNYTTNGEVDANTGKQIVYPSYSHINLHNVICSNTIGSMMSVVYESVTMKSSTAYRFVGETKYIGDDEEKLAQNTLLELENEKFFVDNFYNNGINMVVNQTGFLRAYNWMDVNDSGRIHVGNTLMDSILGTMFGQIINGDPQTFEKYLYTAEGDNGNEQQFLHFAFLVSSGKGILDAPTYLQLHIQDEDYNCFNIQDVNFENVDLGSFNFAKNMLSTMSLKIYGYSKEAEITPFSTYQLNSGLIQELHK